MSLDKPALHIIVPLYNEAPNIGPLLDSLHRLVASTGEEFAARAVFIDDGSSDGTVRCIESNAPRFHHTVLRHETNRGPGAAFATAFEHLVEVMGENDWVLTLEGDNTSDIDTVRHMLTRRREGYDVVLGSPYLYSGGFSHVAFHRILISHIANSLVRLILGIHGIQTFSCFLRLYNAPIIRRLQAVFGPAIIGSRGFECMVELLVKLISVQAKISEVELTVDWSKRAGASKMRILRTTAGYLRLFALWKLGRRRLT